MSRRRGGHGGRGSCGGTGCGAGGGPLVDGVVQERPVDGLGEIVVHSRRPALCPRRARVRVTVRAQGARGTQKRGERARCCARADGGEATGASPRGCGGTPGGPGDTRGGLGASEAGEAGPGSWPQTMAWPESGI